MSLPGAFSETKDATEETQTICDEMKAHVETKTKKTYEEFRAVKYRQQIVAGTYFFIKVHVGGDNYLHLKVFQGLMHDAGEALLQEVQEDMGKDDPILYF